LFGVVVDLIHTIPLERAETIFYECLEIGSKGSHMSKLYTTAQYLWSYSRGDIGPEVAIKGIGVRGFGDLLDTMIAHGIPLPRGRGREDQVEREIRDARPLVRELLWG